jgi:hypothetical protein
MGTPFWVIGWRIRQRDFRTLIDGTSEVLGPFSNPREATLVRRERSDAASRRCRATIVSNVNGAGDDGVAAGGGVNAPRIRSREAPFYLGPRHKPRELDRRKQARPCSLQ